ncbi:MAG: hypothetical protein ACYC4R_02935 [Anaerolineae bacterium]
MNRNIKLLIAARFLANLGFVYPVYTLFPLSRDLNLTSVLTLESVLVAMLILWKVLSRALADRFGKKQIIVFSTLLDVIGQAPL